MTNKEQYEYVLKNIVRKPIGTFLICDAFEEFPYDLMGDETKVKYINKAQTIGFELTDKASDKDYKDYVNYALAYTGFEKIEDVKSKKFDNFNKKTGENKNER